MDYLVIMGGLQVYCIDNSRLPSHITVVKKGQNYFGQGADTET